MVSSTEAGFDLREMFPLPRNTLHNQEMTILSNTGQRTNPMIIETSKGYRGWLSHPTNLKVSAGNLYYPAGVRDTTKSGTGREDNRHLHYLVESISVNVGGFYPDVKASSRPMSGRGVGAAIVVRGWESQPQGEGPQSVGSPT
jgi:hypothetical protein